MSVETSSMPGIQVPHEAVACVAQHLTHLGRVHPLFDAPPGGLVVKVARDGPEGDVAATKDVGDLG